MNKTQLRQSYVDAGWEVANVADWLRVSEVEGKVKYDVNAVSPENVFGTGQVVVTDDNGQNEEATALGFWVDSPSSFEEDLRTWARSFEGVTPAGFPAAIFSVSLEDTRPVDEVGDLRVTLDDGTVRTFRVKRRNDTFTFVELA